jgi:hypothetical protein
MHGGCDRALRGGRSDPMMIGPLCYADQRHEDDVARVAVLCSLININAVCMRLPMIGEK